METRSNQKKWKIFLLTSAILIIMAVYFVFSTSAASWYEAWSKDELDSTTIPTIEVDLGHGPVAHPQVEEGENNDTSEKRQGSGKRSRWG